MAIDYTTMTKNMYAYAGIAAAGIFWITYFLLSMSRPEYSVWYKAVSELGSMDVADKWLWNMGGYIVPGLLIVLFSIGLYRYTATEEGGNRFPLIGLLGSGVLMSVAGIFPGDFDNRQSTTMLLHTIGSFGSYLFFLVGAFTYPARMRASLYWKKMVRPALLCTWVTIVAGSWPMIVPSAPAFGQRIVFAGYFLWILLAAFRLLNQPTQARA